jgi:hypothetical protein
MGDPSPVLPDSVQAGKTGDLFKPGLGRSVLPGFFGRTACFFIQQFLF